jgi:hypothetical protein
MSPVAHDEAVNESEYTMMTVDTVNDLENLPGVPDVVMPRPTIQSCHTARESVAFEVTFDPVKAEQIYTEKRVALMQDKAELQEAKQDFAEEVAEETAALEEKQADFEEEQTLKNEQMLAKEVNLAGREQQCSFRWAKLSTMLRKFEAEEEQKRQQREAGTKRLAQMKERLAKTQDVVNAKEFLDQVLDLDAASESRVAVKAKRDEKANRKIEWGNRVCKLKQSAKARTDHRLVRTVTPAQLSVTKNVQSIYTPNRVLTSTAKGNLVFDENRNVITQEKANSRQSKKVKALDAALRLRIRETETPAKT